MARTPICMCNNCNNIGTVKVPIANRGNRNGWMCDFHARRLEGYSDENPFRKGNRKQNENTFSIELETSHSTEKARGELLNFGFIPTSDCTVSVEYKSPIYEGMNAISKQLVSIEKLRTQHELGIDDTCGTHFHVGHATYINPETMGYIRCFYHSIFLPLSDYMKEHRNETEAFWGRDFLTSGWATPITANTNANEHRNFVNMEHPYTIEFRLAKFKNAKQYMNVAKFAKDATNAIIENFIKHFNDTDFDRTRYANETAYRKHKAQVTANKILKLYIKYASN